MSANSQSRTSRPVNLNLLRFHFPISALTSITHRISGVLLFLGVFVLLYLLQLGLTEEGALRLQAILDEHWSKAIILIITGCASFHLIAGFKHLLLDLSVGESLSASKALSWITWAASGLLAACVAFALWS